MCKIDPVWQEKRQICSLKREEQSIIGTGNHVMLDCIIGRNFLRLVLSSSDIFLNLKVPLICYLMRKQYCWLMDYGRQCNRESEGIKSRELEISIWIACTHGGLSVYIAGVMAN